MDVENKNPPNNNGHTPLHVAAYKGHFDVCRLIIDNVKNKNPADSRGITPLHRAASQGQWKICHLIIQNVENKNPVDNGGRTPLRIAAKYVGSKIWRSIRGIVRGTGLCLLYCTGCLGLCMYFVGYGFYCLLTKKKPYIPRWV